MRIRLLAFATASDALGAQEREIEVPDGATVADLRSLLLAEHPGFTRLWPRLAVAVDGRLVGPEETLVPGCEVALLPPVSGGAPDSEVGPPRAALTDGSIDVAAVSASVAGPGRGALVLFLGTVRDAHAGRSVLGLTYSAYRRMAEQKLAEIVTDLEAGGKDLRVAIVHRLGDVPVGEPSVAIAVASPHRAEAYEASRTALERLKAEVPIWKREHYADGSEVWREEEPLGVGT
ncbi:MAG TPA: molybdenum cofactor biosynthesis protein MoaE [Thermoanaerobaculia bacterium]|jgi:molybdopterin synthase catalytic subunit|nr:molybdenum cofactor biosynthesis protein MoaE [Thermoanaerobaculia bacterium]